MKAIRPAILLIFIFFFCHGAEAQDRARINVDYSSQDSIVTFASSIYQPNSFLRRLFMGNNYREEWNAYVTLPVFHFSQSGFRIKELGGGMQTKSLHLTDSKGKDWSLRTVDKDVSKALPKGVRRTLVRRASQDLVSAAFPYGSPIAGELVNAAGVPSARPQIVYVADDSALGEFRDLFAGTICALEERDPGFDDTDNTKDVAEKMKESSRYKIHQHTYLKARLLDILMADWDRHADNWRWGKRDSAGFTFYYAVPRDRDWVFYYSKGWLPKVAQISGAMRCFIPFDEKIKNVKALSWKAWTLDKNFANELTAADWEGAITEVQRLLTDSVIEAAVRKMPPQIFEMEGADFIRNLKSRRDGMREEVMKYYRFLSEETFVNGTNQAEKFSIRAVNDLLQVSVMRISDGQTIFRRSFSPKETYSVTLNGYDGADVFEVDKNVQSKVRLVINGGDGADRYQIDGKIRTTINDNDADNNIMAQRGEAKVNFK